MELGVGMVKGILNVAQRQVKELKSKNCGHRMIYWKMLSIQLLFAKSFIISFQLHNVSETNSTHKSISATIGVILKENGADTSIIS